MFSSSFVVVDVIFPADSAAAGKILTALLLLLSSESVVLVVLVVAREKASAILYSSTRVRVCVLWCLRACEKNRRLTDNTERKKSKKLILKGETQNRKGLKEFFPDKMKTLNEKKEE